MVVIPSTSGGIGGFVCETASGNLVNGGSGGRVLGKCHRVVARLISAEVRRDA